MSIDRARTPLAIKAWIHRAIRLSGFDLVRYDEKFPQRRRAELMRKLSVELVLDVGANTGQYVDEIRANGYEGLIVAFEPVGDAFRVLSAKAQRDPLLSVHRAAIGSQKTDSVIHVAKNSYSSSLLPMEETHLQLAPNSAYIKDERVTVQPLDTFHLSADWLKIDVQGYERDVLAGASQTLERARAVEIELTYEPLYKGQPLAQEIAETLRDLGFRLAAFGDTVREPALDLLLQVDCIFIRV